MKGSLWIVSCVAALLIGRTAFGQSTNAVTTNAVYNLTTESTFRVGSFNFDVPASATAVFLSDGTCNLNLMGYVFSANYVLSKNGKQISLIPDANGFAAMSNQVVDLIQTYAPGVTVAVKNIKLSKLQITNGGVTLAKCSVGGKLSSYVNSKLKIKGFTLKSQWTSWTLIQGQGF